MFPTLLCPSCKARTPEEGAYCDQCGKPLVRCPSCGLPVVGKHCPRDGAVVGAAAAPAPAAAGGGASPADAGGGTAIPGGAPGPAHGVHVQLPPPRRPGGAAGPGASIDRGPVAPPVVPPAPGRTRRGPSGVVAAPPRLRFVALNAPVAPFDVGPGEVLGRSDGPHAGRLAGLRDHGVSGRHARVDWSPAAGWTLTDVGSSFGLDIRAENAWPLPERSLPPEVPHPLAPGSFVRMGDVVFHVVAGEGGR